jgi:hypothetical protein
MRQEFAKMNLEAVRPANGHFFSTLGPRQVLLVAEG